MCSFQYNKVIKKFFFTKIHNLNRKRFTENNLIRQKSENIYYKFLIKL